MATGSAFRNTVVGLVFLGSIVVLGAATLLVSAVPFLEKVEALEVWFSEVDSLQPGDDVLLRGYRVGQVDDIRYEPGAYPDYPILVRCRLPAKVVEGLGRGDGTKFTIHSAGPLGGRYLEIVLPRDVRPAPEGREPEAGAAKPPLRGDAAGDLFKQLEKLVERNEQSITEAIEGIRATVQDIRQGQGLIGKLVQDPQLAKSFDETVRELRQVFQSINEGKGTIGALVSDEKLRDRVKKAVDDLGDVIEGLKKEEGTVGFLLNNKKAREDIGAAIGDLRVALADVKPAVAGVGDIIQKANSGQGTLGQIINNPRGWEELLKVLVLLRETIEDLREQAPISTFVNALFSTF